MKLPFNAPTSILSNEIAYEVEYGRVWMNTVQGKLFPIQFHPLKSHLLIKTNDVLILKQSRLLTDFSVFE